MVRTGSSFNMFNFTEEEEEKAAEKAGTEEGGNCPLDTVILNVETRWSSIRQLHPCRF